MDQSFEWITKDGKPDSIDPVLEHVEEEDRHIIDNGYHVYEVMKSDIEKWWIEGIDGSQQGNKEVI